MYKYFIVWLILSSSEKSWDDAAKYAKHKMKEHSDDLGDEEWLRFEAQLRQTKNSVFRIVKEVAEGHTNGTAKHWVEGLFKLVTILLETDFEGDEKVWVHSMKFSLSG